MAVINDIDERFDMDISFKEELVKFLKEDKADDLNEINQFRLSLPKPFQIKVAMIVYKNIYSNLQFFERKPLEFISLLCPLLVKREFQQDEMIYSEHDHI